MPAKKQKIIYFVLKDNLKKTLKWIIGQCFFITNLKKIRTMFTFDRFQKIIIINQTKKSFFFHCNKEMIKKWDKQLPKTKQKKHDPFHIM